MFFCSSISLLKIKFRIASSLLHIATCFRVSLWVTMRHFGERGMSIKRGMNVLNGSNWDDLYGSVVQATYERRSLIGMFNV